MTKDKELIKDFIKHCKKELGIQSLPYIKLIADKSWVMERRSFGEYSVDENTVYVYYLDRNTADVLRSLAHELTHHRQQELGMIEADSGKTGSDIENEAHAFAGIIMREYGKLNPSIYELDAPIKEVLEAKIKPENEIFSAYHGRYLFNVTKAYRMIGSGKVKSAIKTFQPNMMYQLSHPEFSAAEPEKVAGMKIDYEKPIGVVVKFEDPESKKTEWILIDGNHRTRKATEEGKEAKFYVIADPKDVSKFMQVDASRAHQLFPDDDE